MTVTTVLFDIDGTLVDSNYLHVEAWSQAFHQVDAQVDGWRIHRSIGMDSGKLLESLLGESSPVSEQAKELHDQNYAQMADRLRPFEKARELIAELSARGLTVVLATSAPEPELKNLRAVLQIEDAIDIVTSGEDVEEAKPAPDIVAIALGRAGVAPSDAVMVGDSVWDVESAGRAEVRCIGVLSGGISEAELKEAGAVQVYADVAALLKDLDHSPLIAGQ